jgi:ABC-type glycerol-3-phosphate transport system permease component
VETLSRLRWATGSAPSAGRPERVTNAYNVFLLRQFFMTIPAEIDEAAALDGAGPLRTLTSVIVPQALPAILIVALFHFYFMAIPVIIFMFTQRAFLKGIDLSGSTKG